MKEDLNGETCSCGKIIYRNERTAANSLHAIKKCKWSAKHHIPKRVFYSKECSEKLGVPVYHLTSMLKSS